MKLVMAILPILIVIVMLIALIIYFERTMKEDDLSDKIAVRFINILLCMFIAWLVYSALYLYKV